MKIKLAVLAVLLLGLTARVDAVGASFNGFPMGSTNVVENYCASNGYFLSVVVYQNTIVGLVPAGSFNTTGDSLGFTNKAQWDVYFQQKLLIAAQKALMNTNAWLDKTFPFWIVADTYRSDLGLTNFVSFFGVSSTPFYMTKINGNYFVPDLSWVKLGFLSEVAYNVKQLKWARMEFVNVNNGTSVVYDPMVNTDDSYYVRPANGVLLVPTSCAVSGTSGPIRSRISLVSGSSNNFQVYGSNGERVAEKPFQTQDLSFDSSSKTVRFKVSGGEVGRVLNVLSAPSAKGPWTNVLSTVTITPYSGVGIDLSFPAPAESQFYREQAMDAVPQY